ncbi:1-phosphatidylinositol 3-phosphate 5-kinase FAB1 [Phytophthora nicotianae]|uniref:1-phosphatidylinositol 3-phosphate 5-kinase FAB1 n=1 Tax=Phytophthora nicotianae TaxID=4792 RepID=A0A0W8DCK5_PHYNI|nr:1-phosphatidylinositol 3-phosphate 5-kinase FAB1 [Phytophthora nicotianae]
MYVAKPKQTQRAKAQEIARVKTKKGRPDFTGASAILEFNLKSDDAAAVTGPAKAEEKRKTLLWLAYTSFHLGNYQRALDAYEQLRDVDDTPEIFLYRACCLFYLQMYKEAAKEAEKGPAGPLQNRLLFHCAHKLGDEDKLLVYHQQLTDSKEDQLSLAAIHYFRNHFQEATDIYKRLLLENRDDIALNVYVAMCYYKLDYYDVSLEIMQAYLQAFPDSVVAVNVKACNQFKLYNGAAAKDEIKTLTDRGYNIEQNDLVSHNMVVFEDGQHALRVLPQFVDALPEARLNLVVYYLKHDKLQEAYDLIKDVEPSTPQEYILKGVVHATLGQSTSSRQHIKTAQQYFQLVGSSPTECDTIPGRQCMASCFYLLKQFEDVNIYLNSIKQYLYNEDDFNWNFGISLCNTGSHQEALETLLRVQQEDYRHDYCYVSWLTRCYILNHNPSAAWDLYLKLDNSDDSFNLLQLIAHDCYKMGEFLYAAKAFDILERLDPDPEYWEGKRGACVGVFQRAVAGKATRVELEEVLSILKANNNPQVEYIVRIMKKWGAENGINV